MPGIFGATVIQPTHLISARTYENHGIDMPVTEGFRDFVLEQLRRVVPVTWRAMFGGVGIYSNGLFFALVDDDTLYFKVDDSNRPDFEKAGMGPFMPFGEGAEVMQYYEVPGDVLEDPDLLADWADKAITVARSKRPVTRRPPPRGKRGKS